IEPPRPPSPPSGPPRGTWASRRNVAAPSPPLPALRKIFTRSRNIASFSHGTGSGPLHGGDPAQRGPGRRRETWRKTRAGRRCPERVSSATQVEHRITRAPRRPVAPRERGPDFEMQMGPGCGPGHANGPYSLARADTLTYSHDLRGQVVVGRVEPTAV